MAFKLLKTTAIIISGMLIAPEKVQSYVKILLIESQNITHNYRYLLIKLKLYEKNPKELQLMKLRRILN